MNRKSLKGDQIWNKRIRFLLVDDLSDIFIFQIILFNFNLQSTATQLAFNLQKIMIFSVSNDGIEWTLDLCPDSVSIAVNDLDQNLTIISQEIPLAAWQLLLSQRQDFLNNHQRNFQLLPTNREHLKGQKKYSPVWGLKTWTPVAIKCPISRI